MAAKSSGGLARRSYRRQRRSRRRGLRHAAIALGCVGLTLAIAVLLAGDRAALYAGTGLTLAALFFLAAPLVCPFVFILTRMTAEWTRHLAFALVSLPVPLGLVCLWVWSAMG